MVPIEESSSKEIHYVADDSMSPVFNHADGKMYDSKSKMRETYRRMGLLEVGNDKVSKYFSKTRKSQPIPEEKFLEAVKKADSHLNDPSFRRHYRERERERNETLIVTGKQIGRAHV